MALGRHRVAQVGETPYPHEKEAIDFAIDALPNVDPYHLWALIDLVEPSSGRLYEIDLLIIGYSAIYLVEAKGGPGLYQGDSVDWLRTPPGDVKSRWMDPPRKLANLKCKVIKSLLHHKLGHSKRVPWIEPLVFLSHENVSLNLEPDGLLGVVTQRNFATAIKSHVFPGAPESWRAQKINRTQTRELVKALESIGFRQRKGKAFAGSYEIGDVLIDGSGYQDREAVHREQERIKRRARIYLVPQQTSVEMRQKLRRAADREAMLLSDVREHLNVLSFTDYITDAPLGPTVLFDDFEGGVPLDVFLRNEADLPLAQRVDIIEQVGRALAHCHRKNVFHGALSPEAILVRRGRDDHSRIEVRLFNFMLGGSEGFTATSHWTSLGADAWAIYSAPELQEDPSSRTPQTDLFSLGSLAYYVITGRPPAGTLSELIEKLGRDRHLDPRTVDDSIPMNLADSIASATSVIAAKRDDDVATWVELFVEAAQPPEPERQDVDPLNARPDDGFGDEMYVTKILGHGASSRVLQVMHVAHDKHYALKVSLSEEHDDRLSAEAEVLTELRHPQIVALIDALTIANRPCLLLTIAGQETLHRALARDGSISLDYASRFGEDLLSALEHLEEKHIVHRDIKPANVGIGAVSLGSGHHLTLFDFSLAKAPLGDIALGTAAYRDPFLRERGQWDSAADRWSTAVTLHEMLTGVRPSYGGPGGSTLDETAELTLAAERFDPGVRDQLVEFFTKALARDLEHRFDSAQSMRHAWIAAFEAPRPSVPSDLSEHDELLTIERLASIEPGTPIELLPISPKARNSLDRAGLERAEHLLTLPDNRLSMIRGVGTAIALEVLDFRERWQKAREIQVTEPTPFFPGYRGEDLPLHDTELDDAVSGTLRDAGLNTLSTVAAAPTNQIEALTKRANIEAAVVQSLLEEENRKADEQAHPSTLEGWVKALLPQKKQPKRAPMQHPRVLFGLDEPFTGRLDVTVKELAEHLDVTTAAIYITLVKSRADWASHTAIGELSELCRDIVFHAGGALPLDRAASELMAQLPHDRGADEAQLLPKAGALWRVVTEIEKEDPSGLSLRRLGDGRPWIFASEIHARAVDALGKVADELAGRSVLASPGEATRILGDVVKGTPLSTISSERLTDLAASASSTAACSARLEIYPRDMPPERTLNLSISLLRSGLDLDDVQRKVRARYPEAAPLPSRPELDSLLARHGLKWNKVLERYERPDQPLLTSLTTNASSLTHIPQAKLGQGYTVDPKIAAAGSFDERLRATVERRGLRVLGVVADRAREAALALSNRLGVAPTSFDELMIAALKNLMETQRVNPDVVYKTDAEGPECRAWPNLLKLAGMASKAVAGQLLPPTEKPLLLVRPGLIARYELEAFLSSLVEASKRDESQAIFLLAPGFEGGIPKINGEMPVPGLLRSQAVWIPREWLSTMQNVQQTPPEAP